jgi:DNA replication protein DnaC
MRHQLARASRDAAEELRITARTSSPMISLHPKNGLFEATIMLVCASSGERAGTGKTHLAIALAVLACQQGRRVRFTTLAALANELQEAESRRELSRVVARYVRTELVVLDELGYLALPAGAAELVFQVISERNERASMIVTTNLPFGEWMKVFPDARLAKAVVDRLTHRAHIIHTGSESWRFRHGLQGLGVASG